ncbi:endonuclease [Ascochyta rabiei]|uniref:Endonuclease n=1 Tax=Didymella rabiei TaxID=5454 RepID=A0A163M2U0_DIDRA|nr:endonuclease [Ascochyta rabiei]
MRLAMLTALSVLASPVMSAGLQPHAGPRAATTQDFRSVTFNIRYAAPASTNERPWSVRGPLVTSQLKNTTATATSRGSIPVIGLQEVLHQQLLDIKAGLGSSWSHLGTGRDDGKASGEYVPLLYQPCVLRLVSSTQKWLSPTPDVPSFWPGAGSRRYVIVAVFEVVATRRLVVVANTHLDNASQTARIEGVKIVLSTIRAVRAQYGALPVVLTGDFNSAPGSGDAYGTADQDGLLGELYALAKPEQRFGPEGTFSGFDPSAEPNDRIDFIWLGPNASTTWEVERYEVLGNVVGGVYISDHRAVVGDVRLL